MDFEHFKEAVANEYQVGPDDAMQELDRRHEEDMLMVELLETGSVSVKLGDRKFILSLHIEEEL